MAESRGHHNAFIEEFKCIHLVAVAVLIEYATGVPAMWKPKTYDSMSCDYGWYGLVHVVGACTHAKDLCCYDSGYEYS